MEVRALEISDSPLTSLNGVYYPAEGGTYRHSASSYFITRHDSKWAVCAGKSVACLSSNIVDDPAAAQWEYYSKKTRSYKASKNMRVKYVLCAAPSEAAIVDTKSAAETDAVSKEPLPPPKTGENASNGHSNVTEAQVDSVAASTVQEAPEDTHSPAEAAVDEQAPTSTNMDAEKAPLEPPLPPTQSNAPIETLPPTSPAYSPEETSARSHNVGNTASAAGQEKSEVEARARADVDAVSEALSDVQVEVGRSQTEVETAPLTVAVQTVQEVWTQPGVAPIPEMGAPDDELELDPDSQQTDLATTVPVYEIVAPRSNTDANAVSDATVEVTVEVTATEQTIDTPTVDQSVLEENTTCGKAAENPTLEEPDNTKAVPVEAGSDEQGGEDGFATPPNGEAEGSTGEAGPLPVDTILSMNSPPSDDDNFALPMERMASNENTDGPEAAATSKAAPAGTATNLCSTEQKNRFAEKFAAAIAPQPAAAFPLSKSAASPAAASSAQQRPAPEAASAAWIGAQAELHKASVQKSGPGQHTASVPSPTPPAPRPYTRAIPVLKSSSSAANWRVIQERDWFGSVTETYYNVETDERCMKMPDCLRNPPNVGSFLMETRNMNQQIEVFSPTTCMKELGKKPINTSCLTEWREIEPFWTSTVASYEHEVATLNHYLRNFRAHSAAESDARERALRETISELQASLQASKEKEQLSQQRADTMMSRAGKSHIKRDWQQTKLESDFPAGEDIRAEFLASFLNFETFACDAVNTLEEQNISDATDVFVLHVMLPLFSVTKAYVNQKLDEKQRILSEKFGVVLPSDGTGGDECVANLFWYSTQQTQLPKEIQDLPECDIGHMMDHIDPMVSQLHSHMLEAAVQGMIDDGEGNLRINSIVRSLLRLHTVAALSDPRCFLHPAPGVRLPYKDGLHQEILSPGTKKYGRIKESDLVEVVLPGLYFDHPDPGVKPTLPCMVRRLITA